MTHSLREQVSHLLCIEEAFVRLTGWSYPRGGKRTGTLPICSQAWNASDIMNSFDQTTFHDTNLPAMHYTIVTQHW